MSDALKSLLSAFGRGVVSVPPDARGFLLRAEAEPALDPAWRQALICEQTDKPIFDRLEASGVRVTRRVEDSHDFGLCLLTKHRGENLANISRAWDLTRAGGVIVCAGANSTGAQSTERAVKVALDGVASVEIYAKHHSRVFWFVRTEAEKPAALARWADEGALQLVKATGCLSRPGIFSWNEVDDGSRLLATAIPPMLGGEVADLGAGWGYLDLELLKRCPGISALDLFEAEWLALDAARANLERTSYPARLSYHWHDVTAQKLPQRYDWIVTNPPFHSGRATDVELGRAFLVAAASGLRPGGALLLVANRQLPYEATLDGLFASWKSIADAEGFKVIEARARSA